MNGEKLINVDVPSDVDTVYHYAFYGYKALESVTFNNTVKFIGQDAFCGCENLKSIYLPNSVEEIGEECFRGCSSLSTVRLSDSLKAIPQRAFRNCSSLTNIFIPDKVTGIKDYAFAYCSNLSKVTIGKSVESITSYAFVNCPELTDVYSYSEVAPKQDFSYFSIENPFKGSSVEYATLHVLPNLIEDYKEIHMWNQFGNIVSLTDTEMNIDDALNTDDTPQTIYNLNGHRLKNLKPGLNIIRSKNGKTKKIIVK